MLTQHILNICSKQEVIALLQSVDRLEEVVLISILDPDDKPIADNLLKKVDDFLIVEFWDIDEESNHPEYPSIDRETAKEIALFIKENRDKKFLVHCAAGVSRSSGVALAVECILRDNGNKFEFGLNGCPAIMLNPRFKPNWLVFDKVVEEFELLKEREEPLL